MADQPTDLKSRSLFARLKRLFSTDVIVRNVGGKKLKVVDTDEVAYATDRNTLRDRFNRIRTSAYNQYSRDFTLSYQAARIELFRDYDCVGPDTIIPLPDGTSPTIAELTEKYKDKPQERFLVFSYDHETDSVKLGKAYHPRKKEGGVRKSWKVIFDNGQYVIGSAGHPFLMRNGEYKKLEELSVGESVMPFYQKDFYNNGYRSIYNFSRGWQSEHVIVAEQFDRPLNDNEVVHHKNFDKTNNLPSNLQIMTDSDHRAFHMHLNNDVIWSPENKEKTIEKVQSSYGYKNRKCHKWNGERSGKNNPFYGKSHSKKSNELRSESLKVAFSTRNQSGENNPKFRNDLSFDVIKIKAFEYYKQNGKLDVGGLCDFIGCDYSTVYNRLHSQKYHWIKFKNEVVSTLNHKIVAIEYVGEIEVYDVTVEKYQNFATDSCFVHNTMDMDPILSSALDIYADESLTRNEMGDMLTIKSPNDNIKQILRNLYYDIMNIEFNLWSYTRNMCKYGDFYLRLYISPEYGVYMVEPISAYNVTRVENSDLYNKNYVKFQVNLPDGGKVEDLENYQVAHFRLLSDSNFLPYGKSMLESARRVWKQLSLMEDAMLIHRIMRAPEKRIFKIDVGNIPPNEIDNYMEKVISKMKKVPYIDEKTGDYNLRFNLQNMVEDFYLPVRGSDSGTSIDTLSGMEFTGTDDIEYLRKKMMAALKIPKAFLSYDEDLSGKATLAQEDVRFSRTIQRIQQIIISELVKIGIVHLYAQGYRDASLVDFSLELTNPSTVFEEEKIAIWSDKVSVAKDMIENKMFSKKWVYREVFNMSDDDAALLKNDIVDDAKQSYRFKQIEDEGNDPAKSFQKVNKDGSTDTMGSESKPSAEPTGEPEPPTSGKESGSPPLKEKKSDYERPSQAGIKKASDYPFGEDVLGNLENNRSFKSDMSITHKFAGGSPFSLESVGIPKDNLTQLDSYLKTLKQEKQELLSENSNKSLMDETNIME